MIKTLRRSLLDRPTSPAAATAALLEGGTTSSGALPTDQKAYAREGAAYAARVAAESTDPEVLKSLAGDTRISVMKALLSNPAAPETANTSALLRGAAKGREDFFHTASPHLSPEWFATFVSDNLVDEDGTVHPTVVDFVASAALGGRPDLAVGMHDHGLSLEGLASDEVLADLGRARTIDASLFHTLEGKAPAVFLHCAFIRAATLQDEDAWMSDEDFSAGARLLQDNVKYDWESKFAHRYGWTSFPASQTMALLDVGTEEAVRMAVSCGSLSAEVLRKHGKLVYSCPPTYQYAHRRRRALDPGVIQQMLDDIGSDPKAIQFALTLASHVFVTEEQGHYRVRADSARRIIMEGQVQRIFMSDDLISQELASAELEPLGFNDVHEKLPLHQALLYLGLLKPEDLDWTTDECEIILDAALDDMPDSPWGSPVSEGSAHPIALRWVDGMLGSRVDRWRLFYTLANDWEGGLKTLIRTILDLCP